MIKVNCGAGKTDVTPFWVAKIVEVSTGASGSVSLKVQWFELVPSQRGPDICYNGRYRSMEDRNTDCIPASSVLVNFASLLSSSKIPSTVQRMTRDELDLILIDASGPSPSSA